MWNAGQTVVMQQAVLDHLDTRREIKNYYVPFIGAILLVADKDQTPSSLRAIIHEGFPFLQHAVMPADPWSVDGWMPKAFWELMHHPQSSGRWDYPPAATPPPSLASLSKLLGVPPKK
jgi:hypothetical protein